MSTRRRDQTEGDLKTKDKVQKPKMFKVMLHNDNYTSMEFVVHVLETLFGHSNAAATRIMLKVHRDGIGVAGVYTREIAESKMTKTLQAAREAGYPLQCTIEPE